MPTPLSNSPFHKKKATILSSISTYTSPTYTDNSPKGSIDAEIIDLINEINDFDGYVTTSSCAGRVAVFVEGRAATATATATNDDLLNTNPYEDVSTTKRAGPGGKGHGNKWLYVSHEPLPNKPTAPSSTWHELFGLTPSQFQSESTSTNAPTKAEKYPSNPRLIKLSFSPLILHILCSDLHTARPLLAAAINAGFRESGVQSLKILDDEARHGDGAPGTGTGGVMLAVRTAGCAFETVVGYVEEGEAQKGEGQEGEVEEVYRSVVSEGWLGVCVGIVNGRFEANGERRERLRGDIRAIKRAVNGCLIGSGVRNGQGAGWEDKESRRVRKREEGLRLKEKKKGDAQHRVINGEVKGVASDTENGELNSDGLADGLFLEDT